MPRIKGTNKSPLSPLTIKTDTNTTVTTTPNKMPKGKLLGVNNLKSPTPHLFSMGNLTPNNSIRNNLMDESDVDLLIHHTPSPADDRDRMGIEHGPILNRGVRGQTIYSDHSKYPSVPGSDLKKMNSVCTQQSHITIPESNTLSPTLTFSLPAYLRKSGGV